MVAKLKDISAKDAATHLKEVQDVFNLLAKKDVYKSGFSEDKGAISKVFKSIKEVSKTDILVRLTLIDSMYSTQMSRRYYALDELATALFKLSGGKDGKLEQMFLDFAAAPEQKVHLFDYEERDDKGNIVCKNLFSECYGIGKGGADKGVAISLISKYAYFETNFKFPIYDSIACEIYPLVWHFCGFGKDKPKLIHSENGKVVGDRTMVEYVKAINLLIDKIDCKEVNYDLLDRFLWFVGKIRRGNLSLVLSREEYIATINIFKAQNVTEESSEYFNIEKVDLSKLTYLKKNSLLYKFFEFARIYGHKK